MDAGYKSEAVDNPQNPVEGDLYQITESEVNGEISELFNGPSQEDKAVEAMGLTVETGPNPDQMLDPLTGELVTNPQYSSDYIPTPQDINEKSKQADIKLTAKDWEDKVLPMYKESLKTLKAKRDAYTEKMESGLLSPQEADYAREVLDIIEASITTCEKALNEIPDMVKQFNDTKANELKNFQTKVVETGLWKDFNKGDFAEKSEIIDTLIAPLDIDGDGYIGETIKLAKSDQGSVLMDADGKVIKKLSPSGIPGTNTWYDMGLKLELSQKGLKLLDDKKGNEHFTLDITNPGQFLEKGNGKFDTKMNLSNFDYITVKTGPDGTPKVKNKDGENYLSPVALEQEGTKIVQNTPGDIDKYTQVRITRIEVVSEEESQKENGDKGYDQLVRYYDVEGNIALELRLTSTVSGFSASDFGLSMDSGVDGKQSVESKVIDAKKMYSTYAHEFKDGVEDALKDEYGIDLSKCSDKPELAKQTFNETWDKFKGQAKKVEKDSKEATGLMLYDVSGYVTGSAHGNNAVFFRDVDKLYDQAPPEGQDHNALWSNNFVGQENKNYNFVAVKGGGDAYASGVSAFWRSTPSKKGLTAVSVNKSSEVKLSAGKEGDSTANYETMDVAAFVYTDTNGDVMIDNPSDTNMFDPKEVDYTHGDDYFNTQGEGSYSLPQTNDDGTLGDPDADTNSSDNGALGKLEIKKLGKEIEDALNKMDETEEDDPYFGLDPKALGGDFYAEGKDTNDQFFTDIAAKFKWSDDPWLDEAQNTGTGTTDGLSLLDDDEEII